MKIQAMINALQILLIMATVLRKGDYHDRCTQKLPGSWFGDIDAFIRNEGPVLGELLWLSGRADVLYVDGKRVIYDHYQ